MSIDTGIFKAYDVRGIYPDGLNEDVAYRIGNAYAVYLKPDNVCIGRDMRDSSGPLVEALVKGLTDAGVDVVDVGMIATDMIYFAVGKYGYGGGIMVTASHNPKEYNGMKMMREKCIPLSGDAGIPEIRDMVVKGDIFKAPTAGKVTQKDIFAEYKAHIFSFVDKDAIAPLKVVIDTANGMGGLVVPIFFDDLKCEVVPMYFEVDGDFPNHEANPLLPENMVDLIARVKEEKADIGLAFDGDADRCFFVDDKGNAVAGDFVTALLAQAVAEKTPGAKILYDVRASWAVKDIVEKAGGEAFMNRVGHAFFKQRMREIGGRFGGEVSGHYYFAENFNCDSGIIPALVMLDLLSRKKISMSAFVEELQGKYFITGEINSKVDNAQAKIDLIKEKYSDGKVYFMDGVSVEYDDWHFNVRASNTEPLLRLNLEAMTREKMEEKRDEVLAIIRG